MDYMDMRDILSYFLESFSRGMNQEISEIFYQDNLSYSKKGVIRGLHFQWERPMGKLVQAVTGKIIDYIVDIRIGSRTLGKYWSFELSEKNKNTLWVPPGFAHGFEALEDSHVLYKCSAYYNKDGEAGIDLWDKTLNIPYLTSKKDAIISEKDLTAQSYSDYLKEPKFFY